MQAHPVHPFFRASRSELKLLPTVEGIVESRDQLDSRVITDVRIFLMFAMILLDGPPTDRLAVSRQAVMDDDVSFHIIFLVV
jgi:hypothetical protein